MVLNKWKLPLAINCEVLCPEKKGKGLSPSVSPFGESPLLSRSKYSSFRIKRSVTLRCLKLEHRHVFSWGGSRAEGPGNVGKSRTRPAAREVP